MSAPGPALVATDVTVSYGGSLAVDGVTLRAEGGTITGLIGPNGAGKTTMFNALSGLIAPDSGELALGGRSLTRLSAPRRAAAGLGRTFQQPALIRSLSVRDNVRLGYECRNHSWGIDVGWLAGRGRRPADTATEAALEICGLSSIANWPAESLTLGQQRFAELARAYAGGYGFVLLDEPASGLDDGESAALTRILSQIVLERGTGVLLVEHDMALVMGTCSHVWVLDAGKLIFSGTPRQLRASDVVRRAYLGDASLESPLAKTARGWEADA